MNKQARLALLIGAASAFLAVVFGAFGAHMLASRVSSEFLSIWETAVFYQIVHALALILLGLFSVVVPQTTKHLTWILYSFVLGIVLFSGSLYILVLSGVALFGAITPLGGILFLLAWALWVRLVLRLSVPF